MKMKEQNAWLAIAGSFQLVFMGTAATAATEMFKSDGNRYLLTFASMIAIGTLIAGAAIYLKIVTEAKKHKK